MDLKVGSLWIDNEVRAWRRPILSDIAFRLVMAGFPSLWNLTPNVYVLHGQVGCLPLV